MPVHDWTLVESGIFHAFHTTWFGALQIALNDGVLPDGYYALSEQHAGKHITDVLTLHESDHTDDTLSTEPLDGGIAVAEAPPKVRFTESAELGKLSRSLAIRHVSGHRLIALLEIVSPSNKDRKDHLKAFARKAATTIKKGIHLLVVDLFPPGKHDPRGIHAIIRRGIGMSKGRYELTSEEPLTLASYAAGERPKAYVEQVCVGSELPDMPLFLQSDRYVSTPLEATYQTTYRGMPKFWRNVLEGGLN